MIIKTVIDAHETYKLYVASCKSTKKTPVSKEVHKQILDTYGEVLQEVLVEEGHVTLCGTILKMIIYREKGYSTEHKQSKIYKTLVLNFNEHTFGWIASIIWDDFGLKKKKNYLFKRSEYLADKVSSRLFSDPKHILTYQLKNKHHG